jgi:hypothetical protein
MKASDAALNFELVNISLIQLSACTCGKRLSSMFEFCAARDASTKRSCMARWNSKPGDDSAAMIPIMSEGMPADLRVIDVALSWIHSRVS